jgi:hypothetical protein
MFPLCHWEMEEDFERPHIFGRSLYLFYKKLCLFIEESCLHQELSSTSQFQNLKNKKKSVRDFFMIFLHKIDVT